MSVKRFIYVPTITGVVAGKTATMNLPRGVRYHTLRLNTSDTAGDAVGTILGEMRLKINGKVNRTFTATELDALNKFNGSQYGAHMAGTNLVAGNAGHAEILPIFLAEPWRKSFTDADGLAWATGGVKSFQLEMDIAAGAAGVAISAVAEIDNSLVTQGTGANAVQVAAPIGGITKWSRVQIPVNGTTQDYHQFPVRDFYQQISFFDANITKVEVKVNGFVIREVTKQENDSILVERGMTPVAGRFDLVFDHDDNLNSSLPMTMNGQPVDDFAVKLTLSDGTARNISTIYQTFGNPE